MEGCRGVPVSKPVDRDVSPFANQLEERWIGNCKTLWKRSVKNLPQLQDEGFLHYIFRLEDGMTKVVIGLLC